MQIKRQNFVNESHLLIWGKLQLGLTRQPAGEPSTYYNNETFSYIQLSPIREHNITPKNLRGNIGHLKLPKKKLGR